MVVPNQHLDDHRLIPSPTQVPGAGAGGGGKGGQAMINPGKQGSFKQSLNKSRYKHHYEHT